jgi:flagellar biosynthesis/type III secretory pathway M-ring protein FliF/YscJ
VAKKKKKKRNWLKTLLFLILTPFIIWFLAFLIWFYWNDLAGPFSRREKTPATSAGEPVDRSNKQLGQSDKASQERIREEDRKQLDEILKKPKVGHRD